MASKRNNLSELKLFRWVLSGVGVALVLLFYNAPELVRTQILVGTLIVSKRDLKPV